jgi:predicted Zn-ribbon and HTH transcriptional regulator
MESAAELIKRVNLSHGAVATLQTKRDRIRDDHIKHKQHVQYDLYTPMIRNLNDAMDAELKRVQTAQDNLTNGVTMEIETALSVVSEVQRILDLLRIPTRGLRDIDASAITYCGQSWHPPGYREALPYLYQGSRLNIRLFIVENKKPKNRFSLCALGDTVFPEELLKLEHSYGCPFSTDHQFRLVSHMRDGASAEELKSYAERKRTEMVVRLKGDYDDVLADYEDVQKSYRADDFLALMLSRCVCGYFKTRLDGSYEQKNGTCPRCQSQMREV